MLEEIVQSIVGMAQVIVSLAEKILEIYNEIITYLFS